jgi:hypothetical protein
LNGNELWFRNPIRQYPGNSKKNQEAYKNGYAIPKPFFLYQQSGHQPQGIEVVEENQKYVVANY